MSGCWERGVGEWEQDFEMGRKNLKLVLGGVLGWGGL